MDQPSAIAVQVHEKLKKKKRKKKKLRLSGSRQNEHFDLTVFSSDFMACFSTTNTFVNLSIAKTAFSRRLKAVSGKSFLVRSASGGSLLLQAAKLLGSASRFEASKLKVMFFGEETEEHPASISRTYTFRHCDITANLTLAVSQSINNDQLRGWFNRLQRDDVVAEWKKVKEEMCLHVHCHVSGGHPLLDLAAELRYHIFSKELPLVLKAVMFGDGILFNKHPELMESLVCVYFHSNSKKFNRVECWGPLRDASQGAYGGQLSVGNEGLKKWAISKSCQLPCTCCFPPLTLKANQQELEGHHHHKLQH